MFSIARTDQGDIRLAGRFDASRTDEADAFLSSVTSTCRVDLQELEYISSAGLGILLKAQKRLMASGNGLILTNLNKLVKDIFRLARFDVIFKIEQS
jgi:anti-sigma B factor antagonist